jgi:Holliday junction resolvase RusA-like endonuclease
MSSLLDRMVETDARGGSDDAPLFVVKVAYPEFRDGRTDEVKVRALGKERHRDRVVTRRDGRQFVTHYTPKQTRDFEAKLRAAALDQMRGRAVLDEALDLTIFCFYPVPESWPEKRKDAARAGLIRPTVKPDWDNAGKLTDALSPQRDKRTKLWIPILWRDDAIIVDAHVHKLYSSRTPGIIIEIRRAGLPPKPWAPPAALIPPG